MISDQISFMESIPCEVQVCGSSNTPVHPGCACPALRPSDPSRTHTQSMCFLKLKKISGALDFPCSLRYLCPTDAYIGDHDSVGVWSVTLLIVSALLAHYFALNVSAMTGTFCIFAIWFHSSRWLLST